MGISREDRFESNVIAVEVDPLNCFQGCEAKEFF